MSKILDKKYYEENPQYSQCLCIKCEQKTMRIIGIESSEEHNTSDKTLYKCEKCGQQAYIDIEWVFTIKL